MHRICGSFVRFCVDFHAVMLYNICINSILKGSPGVSRTVQGKMRLGASTNMFSNRPRAAKIPTYAAMTESLADAGFDVAELDFGGAARDTSDGLASADWEAAVDAAGEAAARRGLPVVQVAAPNDPFVFIRGSQPSAEREAYIREMIRRSAVAAGRLGAAWLIVQPLSDTVNCEYDTSVELETSRAFYAPILEVCRSAGVGLAFENTCNNAHFDLRRIYGENPEDIIALVDSFGDASVGACWNFGRANFMLADQGRALRKMGRRVRVTHASDNRGEVDSRLIPFVGGNVKWEKIMPVLCETGYEGDIVIDAPSYTRDFPDELMPDAMRFALLAGRHLLSL